MKKNVIGALCLLISSIAFSQTTVIASSSGHGFRINPEELPEKAMGSMYYSESFLPAKISGDEEILLLRYNAHKDEMEYEQGKDLYYLIKPDNIEVSFINSGKVYKYLSYEDAKGSARGFLVKLVDTGNTYSLYKREYISYIPAKDATNGYDRTRPAEFKKTDDTFYIGVNGKLETLPKNRRALLNRFSDNKDQISQYLKKNKVSFSNETDLIDLVSFLNTL